MADDADDHDEERKLRIDLMKAQINLAKRQFVWEQWKGFATLIGGIAVFIGGVIAVSTWLHPAVQPQLTQFPPGTVITIAPSHQ